MMLVTYYTVLNSKGQVILYTMDEDLAWKTHAENKDAIMQISKELI